MLENPFEQKINQLKLGEITELIIDPKDFITFREVWKVMDDRAKIVGEAGLNGRVIYRYVPNK